MIFIFSRKVGMSDITMHCNTMNDSTEEGHSILKICVWLVSKALTIQIDFVL
jgi:hypothetical protein